MSSKNCPSSAMEPEHLRVGRLGETVVAKYLVNIGHEVVDRNYREPWGEIDIVTLHGRCLHFVEVKAVKHNSTLELMAYRTDSAFSPEQQVDRHKKHRLRKVIESWLLSNDLDVPMQVDVASAHLVEVEKFAAVDFFPHVDIF